MSRVVIATFVAPLIVSAIVSGYYFWLTYPFMLVFTALFGIPVFALHSKFQLLNWIYAALTGVIVSLIYCLLNTHDADYLISTNNIWILAIGIGISILFWWIAIFRNPKYGFVPVAWPKYQLALIPLFILGAYCHNNLAIEHYRGRVVSLQFVNPYPIPSNQCTVDVLLSNGKNIKSDFWGCNWPMQNIIDRCFHIDNRWSTLRFRRVYSISSLLGGDSDEC